MPAPCAHRPADAVPASQTWKLGLQVALPFFVRCVPSPSPPQKCPTLTLSTAAGMSQQEPLSVQRRCHQCTEDSVSPLPIPLLLPCPPPLPGGYRDPDLGEVRTECPEVSPSHWGARGRGTDADPSLLPRQCVGPRHRQLLAVLRGSVASQMADSETGRGAEGGCMTVLHRRGGPCAAPWLRQGHLCPHPRWLHLGWLSLHMAWERAGGTQGQGPPRTALGTSRPLTW